MIGFNAGVSISLGDMEIALDYLQDKDIYREELAEVRHKRVGSSSQNEVDTEQPLMSKTAASSNTDNYDEEDEDLDFGDEDSEEEDLEFDFEDEEEDFEEEDLEDEDLEDEDSEDEDSEEEDLDFDEEDEEDEEDLDFGDDEDEEPQPVKVAKVQVEQPVKTAKSDRELELEKRLAQFEKAEAVRKENERIEAIEKQRALAIQESANAKKREAELERKLAEAEKLLRERESNESIESHHEAKHSNHGNSNSNNTNTSTGNDKAKQQRQLVKSETAERKVINNNTNDIDYSKLEIEALWKEVRKFMMENGVASQLVSKSIVEKKFGAINIKKLYLKGYLIPFGSKLTIGK